MDSYSTPGYETKIENFDPCIMDVNNQHQQREITSNVVGQASIQTSQENNIDNNIESTAIHEENGNENLQTEPIQSNFQHDMTLTPVRLPAILDGEFFTVIRVDDSNVSVRCNQCQKMLNGNLKSTGNFLSHIKRLHPTLLEKIKCKSNLRKPATVYIDMSAEKCPEIIRTKRGYRKCYNVVKELQYKSYIAVTSNCYPFEGNFNFLEGSKSKLQSKNDTEGVDEGLSWNFPSPSEISERIEIKPHPDEEECQINNEDSLEQSSSNGLESPVIRRRKLEEGTEYDSPVMKHQQNNPYVMEDEFDAIGRNIAAKLRKMRFDQRIIAEKLLNDVLFEAQLCTLQRHSIIQI